MESAGSAVVEFGRFSTGFLVVMGIGMCFSSTELAERRFRGTLIIES